LFFVLALASLFSYAGASGDADAAATLSVTYKILARNDVID